MAARSGASEGGVSSVNGKAGNVILDGTDLDYTPFYAGTGSTATTIAGQIQHMENHVGPADVIWSEVTLDAAAPLAATTYPMTAPSLWVPPLAGAPITITAGRDVTMTNPASIDGLGGTRVALIGDVAGPLVSGEFQARGIVIGNTNAGGSDLQAESLGGRIQTNDATWFVGTNAGTIENMVGGSVWNNLAIVPPAPGSVGLSMDGTIAFTLLSNSFVVAPGTSPYTGFTIESTCTVVGALSWAVAGWPSADPGDAFIRIDPAATLPTGPIPTDIVGLSTTGTRKSGPGNLFDTSAGGLDETSIKVFSAGHQSAPSSRYLGDALYDVTLTAAAPDASLTHVGVAPTVDVVPSDNASGGGTGATLVTLALDAISQRFTLVNPSPQAWYVRYDGAPGDLRGTVIWRAQVLKGGGSAATVQGYVQESVGGGGFVTIPQTASITRGLVNNIPGAISGQAPITLSSDHRYRIVMATTDNAIPTLIRSLTIEVAGTP